MNDEINIDNVKGYPLSYQNEYDYPPTQEELEWLRDRERNYTIVTFYDQVREQYWDIIEASTISYVDLIENGKKSTSINLLSLNAKRVLDIALALSQRGFDYSIDNSIHVEEYDMNSNPSRINYKSSLVITKSDRTPTILPKKLVKPEGDSTTNEYKLNYILECLDVLGYKDQWDTIFMNGMYTRAKTEDRLRSKGQLTYSNGMNYDDLHALRVRRINAERKV